VLLVLVRLQRYNFLKNTNFGKQFANSMVIIENEASENIFLWQILVLQ